MITLGYITKINNPDDNIYEVRLPIFEKAGSSKDLPDLSGSYFQATLSQTPGQLNGFLVGDCVVVGFLDNKYSKPVILGKLFVGDDGARGYLNVNALNVSGSVSLSGDIHIGDITYDQLLELVRGVPNLQEQVDKLLAGGGGGEPDNYIVSASVSGNDLTLVPNTGNPIVYSPSTITSVNWGDIEGTLSDQTDLQEALDEKLELYEIQPTDIESIQGNRYILTKDLTDKITSGKYLLKINSNLFEEEPDPDNYTELILKPAFNLKSEWLPQEGIDKVYEFETISTFFDTGITLAIFAYNETLDRCIFDTTTSQKSITIPIGLQADTANNSIKLYSGDVGYGDEAYLATINNQPIVGGGNIDTPNDNDYHEPRFSSGLSIASSSNLSEIHVPYATSSTYGVLKDIYYPSSNPSNFASQDYVNTMAAYAYASAVSYVSSVLSSYATKEWTTSSITTAVNTVMSTVVTILASYATQSYAETAAYYAYSSAIAYTDSKLASYATQEYVSNVLSSYATTVYADNVAYLAGSTAYTNAVSYVDSNYLPLSGGSMSGSINLGGYSLLFNDFDYLRVDSDSQLIYGNSADPGIGGVVATTNMIPAVYDATLTVQFDGSTVGTFTANQSTASTININVSNIYASKNWVTSELSNYLPLSGGTITGSLSVTGNVNAQTLSIASFGITPYENGIDITNTYGTINVENYNGGNIYLATSSGSVIMSAYGISMNAEAVSVNATSGFFYNGYTVATTFDIGSSTLTLQLDGSDVGTFNANATSNVTVNFNLSNVYASKSWVLDRNYVDQSDLDSAVYYGYVSAVSYVDTTLSSYATKDYVGSTLSGYVPYVTGTSDISVGNVNARTLDIASFGITPYENGVDITNSYGNLNIETFGGNFNITTSSGIAYYNGEEIATKSYAEYVASLAYASAVSAASSYTDTRTASANSYAEYVAAVAYASAVSYLNKPLNLSLNGYGIGTYYPSSGAIINLNLSASGYTTVVANPQAPTTSTLTSIAIGGVNYLLPSGSGGGGGGDYVPYSGASRYVDLNNQNITNVNTIYAGSFNLSNAHTSGSVYIAYESPSYRMHIQNAEGTIRMEGWNGVSIHARSGNINFWPDSSHKLYYGSSYWSNEVATIGTFDDYGITQFSGSLSLNSPFGITLSTVSGPININGPELLFNSSPVVTENDLDDYATEDYVDTHHTMVNATSLTDVDIDKILVKGGIVILDDEQLSLTLAPPGEQLSLTMTNSINNDSTLSPTMLNTIDNNDNAGLTPTMVSTELSI